MRILVLSLLSLGLWGQVQPGRPVLYDSNGNVSVGNTVLGTTGNPNKSTDISTPETNPDAGVTGTYTKGGKFCSLSPAGVETCTQAYVIDPTTQLGTGSGAITIKAGGTSSILITPGTGGYVTIGASNTNGAFPIFASSFQCGNGANCYIGSAIQLRGDLGLYGFAPSINASIAPDSSISRGGAAATIAVGNGTVGDATGTIKVAKFLASGTQSVTGCSLTAAVGGASAGKFASGTTGICTVTVTPGITAPNGYSCWANDLTTPANKLQQLSNSQTAPTLGGTTVSGDVVTWGCIAY